MIFTLQNTAVDLIKSSSLLKRRGPDCQNHVISALTHDRLAVFYGSVLHFRGHLTQQPITNNGNVLLWNGEIFGGIEVSKSKQSQ